MPEHFKIDRIKFFTKIFMGLFLYLFYSLYLFILDYMAAWHRLYVHKCRLIFRTAMAMTKLATIVVYRWTCSSPE